MEDVQHTRRKQTLQVEHAIIFPTITLTQFILTTSSSTHSSTQFKQWKMFKCMIHSIPKT